MRRILATALILFTMAVDASAGVRSFFTPMVLGDRVAFCTTGKDICGKPIADAWCRHQGFDAALLYQRGRPQGAQLVRYADTGDVCTGGKCQPFAQIKCISQN